MRHCNSRQRDSRQQGGRRLWGHWLVLGVLGWAVSLGIWSLAHPEQLRSLATEAEVVSGRTSALMAQTQADDPGLVRYQSGDYRGAIAQWQALLSQVQDADQQAKLHRNLAQAFLAVGDREQALAHWQQAASIYRDRQDWQALAPVLTELGQVHHDRGQQRQAIKILKEAIALAQAHQNLRTESAAQGALAVALWATGDYDQADLALQRSLALAEQLGDRAYLAALWNNQGNLYRSRVNRYRYQLGVARSEGDAAEVQRLANLLETDTTAALAAYRQSLQISEAVGPQAEVETLLNLHRMLLERSVQQQDPESERTLKTYRDRLQAQLVNLPNAQPKADGLITLAYQLLQVRSSGQGRAQPGLAEAEALLEQALAVSQAISDTRSLSYALGGLGQIAEQRNQLALALERTNQAWFAAQQVQAPDSLYRWQWQAARILKRQNEPDRAIAAYRQAVKTLQQLRGDILAANRDTQFEVRDAVEPVYRELIDLLLVQARRAEVADRPRQISLKTNWLNRSKSADDSAQVVEKVIQASELAASSAAQQQIGEAINVLEFLKLAELQNFFGDDCIRVAMAIADWRFAWEQPPESGSETARAKAKLAQKNTTKVNLPILEDPDSAAIYSIILPDRTELIVQLPSGQLAAAMVPLGEAEIIETVNQFRSLLERPATEEYIEPARSLFNTLIRPLEPVLAEAKPKTLVFVQDGVLRKIPMSALYNGERFLVESYAIATTPSLGLTQTKPFDRQNLQALVAGLTVARDRFPALPNVSAEVQQVARLLTGTTLLDQEFTLAALADRLENDAFPIVHLATHGKFGVDDSTTFLLDFQGRITLGELESLFRERREQQPVELLTLSACQTAAGDDRSALGIAGVAVRSGVRRALATLWFINDETTVYLVEQFYRELLNPQNTPAQALQAAQRAMIRDLDLSHPANWSAFILIGSWR